MDPRLEVENCFLLSPCLRCLPQAQTAMEMCGFSVPLRLSLRILFPHSATWRK